jgi:ribonuclease HI
MMEKICHRAVIRTSTLPHTHPLQEVIQGYTTRTLQRQPPLLYNLIRIFNIKPGDIETIRPVTRPPSHTHSFTVARAKSREASIEFEKTDTAEIKIFVDGSGIEDNAGAAAVLYRRGRPNPEKILRYHLGDLTQHTNYEVEAVGLLMAMWMLRNQHVMGHLHVSIYIDSQALTSSFGSRDPRSGQYLLEDIITYAEVANTPQKKNLLHLRWISAHSGVPGNERADEEAKHAAQGASSPPLIGLSTL